jgi:transcriptional regulator with XRE-family HTH domain
MWSIIYMKSVQIKRAVEIIREFPGLGQRIKKAREGDPRSLSQICRESGVSRSYWYQLESEDLRAPATEEIVRKIERILDVDLGVNFDDAN